MLKTFKELGFNRCLNARFLYSHNSFPENLETHSEEQRKKFHHKIRHRKETSRKWNIDMMADFFWLLQQKVQDKLILKKMYFYICLYNVYFIHELHF